MSSGIFLNILLIVTSSVFINLGDVIHISGILEILDYSLNILFFFTYFVHYLFFISFKYQAQGFGIGIWKAEGSYESFQLGRG